MKKYIRFDVTEFVKTCDELLQEAAYIFKINNPDIVQCVFKTWLIYMYKVLSDPIIKRKMFVKLEDLPKPLPQPFDNPILNKVRAVIDATLIEVILTFCATSHIAYVERDLQGIYVS